MQRTIRIALIFWLCGIWVGVAQSQEATGWKAETRERTHEVARHFFAAMHDRRSDPDLKAVRGVLEDLETELVRSSTPEPIRFGPRRRLRPGEAPREGRGRGVLSASGRGPSEAVLRDLLTRLRQERKILEEVGEESPRRLARLRQPIEIARRLEMDLEDVLARSGGERSRALRSLRARLTRRPPGHRSAEDPRSVRDSESSDLRPRFRTHAKHREP